MTKASPDDRIEFLVLDEAGGEIESVDPVIDFRETETTWDVTNTFFTYRILRKPGRTYVLRQRADDVSHVIEELEKGKHK